MKKFLLIAIAFFAFMACDDEDTSDLRDELKNQGDRLEMLENEVEALKVKIEGLNQTYKAVTEMLGGGLITAVEAVTGEGGKSGYKLTIQTPKEEGDGFEVEDYTIWNGESVAGPSLGVEKDGDNGYYWTLGDEPLEDADGKKIYTSGIAPKLRINEGRFEISYDGGDSYKDLGVFSGTVTAGSDIRVEKNGNVVVIKQEGKDDIEIPITPTTTLDIEFTNITETAGLSIMQNSVYVVKYEPKNAKNATVKVEMLNGTDFEVENLPAQKQFKITAKGQNASDVVLVHVYDGTVCMHTSFNVTSTAAITASNVILPLEQENVTHAVQLKLPAGITGAISISHNTTLPAEALEIPSTVSVSNGSATFNVVVKPSSLAAGITHTLQLVFSKEEADYPVLGSVTIITGVLGRLNLGEGNYYSPYTRPGTEGANNPAGYVPLCDGLQDTYWTSNYTDPLDGDPTYGVYIDIVLPQKVWCMKIVYAARGSNGDPRAITIGINTNNSWQTMDHITEYSSGKASPYATSIYNLSNWTPFNQVRFGVTQSNMGDLIENSKASAAISALDVYALY